MFREKYVGFSHIRTSRTTIRQKTSTKYVLMKLENQFAISMQFNSNLKRSSNNSVIRSSYLEAKISSVTYFAQFMNSTLTIWKYMKPTGSSRKSSQSLDWLVVNWLMLLYPSKNQIQRFWLVVKQETNNTERLKHLKMFIGYLPNKMLELTRIIKIRRLGMICNQICSTNTKIYLIWFVPVPNSLYFTYIKAINNMSFMQLEA